MFGDLRTPVEGRPPYTMVGGLVFGLTNGWYAEMGGDGSPRAAVGVGEGAPGDLSPGKRDCAAEVVGAPFLARGLA